MFCDLFRIPGKSIKDWDFKQYSTLKYVLVLLLSPEAFVLVCVFTVVYILGKDLYYQLAIGSLLVFANKKQNTAII